MDGKKAIILLIALVAVAVVARSFRKGGGAQQVAATAVKVVSPEDSQTVKKVIEEDKPFRFNISKGTHNPEMGQFFVVAASIPDGSRLQLALVGLPNQIQEPRGFFQTSAMIVKGKVAVSGRFHGFNRSPLPKGTYTLILTEAPRLEQPENFKKFLNSIPAVKNPGKNFEWGPKLFITKSITI
ncbi:MAG: hypothetical protein JNL01_03395 [Bdellovibrionales bacterium]|nr:hypothetical protein [Bdellovibrionales bacterium]